MIIEMTALELKFLEETLESVLEELQGFEECGDANDYVFTTGAVDLCRESLLMIRRLAAEVENENTLTDT